MSQYIISTSRIPCKYCAISLEEELEEVYGIEMAKVDYETDTIKILFKVNNIDINKIKSIIENSGYKIKKIIVK